ncbi:MAG: glycosyltransferase [Ferruginibacter sp.]
MQGKEKVLIIPSWYPTIDNPVAGSFFKEQAELLANNGYDIKVLFGIYEPARHKQKPGRKKRLLLLLKEIVMPRKFEAGKILTRLQADTDTLLQNPPAYSFRLDGLSDLEEKDRFAVICEAYAMALQKFIDKGWKPDVIHAQSTLDAGIFAHYLSEKFNIPFVIIEHQVFLLHRYSGYHQQLVLAALAKANKVGVVSEHQKKMVLMNLSSCDPVVIWNLVDESRFRIKENKREKPFTVVSITYPTPIKDHITFFKAMKELSQSGENFRYIVIGNASFADISNGNSDVFKAYSKELGIDHLGTFIPYLNRDQIADQLAECDVFVSTSIAETFGVAAREAMMCGLPVVTTACGGIEDSITANTGVVVPIKDYKAIAAAILKIKNGQLAYDPQGIRDFVTKQCGKESFLKKMTQFYTN